MKKRFNNETSFKEINKINKINKINNNNNNIISNLDYLNGFSITFGLLLIIRTISASWNIIADCDEVYNYWEPAHYLLYNFGFQTWEYSPIYALRSYLYVGLHCIIGKVFSYIFYYNDKLGIFFGIRQFLGIFSALNQALLCNIISLKLGKSYGRYMLFFLLISPGMFHASTAFLPSSFVMHLITLVYYFWLKESYGLGILFSVISVCIGWPFVGMIFIPFCINTLSKYGFFKSISIGFISILVNLLPEIGINYYYYKKFVFPAWNMIKYNVYGGGSTLYGVESWIFYLKNLFLNMNFIFPLSLLSVLTIFLNKNSNRSILMMYVFPVYLWFTIMNGQAHKEERFLFPVYPLVCLAASICWGNITGYLEKININKKSFKVTRNPTILPRYIKLNTTAITCLLFMLVTLFSVSRIYSVLSGYSAPLIVYKHLYADTLPQKYEKMEGYYKRIIGLNKTQSFHKENMVVCLGKEWHRFPSSFFLPSNTTQISFLSSGFKGQLPQPYSIVDGTSRIPLNMNGQNREETSRYTEISECDYIIDLIENIDEMKKYTQTNNTDGAWQVVKTYPFLLNQCNTSSLFRAFYIPVLSLRYVKYGSYVILRQSRYGPVTNID